MTAGLPVAWTDGSSPRPRIRSVPRCRSGMAADGELIDVVLTERWPVWRVREALVAVLPGGLAAGRPAGRLAGRPAIGRARGGRRLSDRAWRRARRRGRCRAAAAELLEAPRIPRERPKGAASSPTTCGHS